MRTRVRSMVDSPGTSVMVSVERSRAVTTTLPPMRIRVIALSPVVTRSRRRMSSLNLSGAPGSEARVTVTGPITVVTTPTRSWPQAGAVIATDSASDSGPSVRVTILIDDLSTKALTAGHHECSAGARRDGMSHALSERELGMQRQLCDGHERPASHQRTTGWLDSRVDQLLMDDSRDAAEYGGRCELRCGPDPSATKRALHRRRLREDLALPAVRAGAVVLARGVLPRRAPVRQVRLHRRRHWCRRGRRHDRRYGDARR